MIRKCESCYYQVEQRSSQNQKAYFFYETYSTFTALMFLKGIFKLSSFRTIKIHEIDSVLHQQLPKILRKNG